MAFSNSGYIQRDLLIMDVWSVSVSATGSSLFRAMACRQLGDKQLPRSTPSCFQLLWIFSSSGSILLLQIFHSVVYLTVRAHLPQRSNDTTLCSMHQARNRSVPALTTDFLSYTSVIWVNHITIEPRYIAGKYNKFLSTIRKEEI